MSVPGLEAIALRLVAEGRGLLAIDESIGTCNQRLKAASIPQTLDKRRAWRELLITTPNLEDWISGVILVDETIRQTDARGERFVDILSRAGLLIGVKVDMGARPMAGHAGEAITEGLDDLRLRLKAYAGLGAAFAKWRAVFTLGPDTPSRACIEANAHALARYAGLCQEAGLVPIIEPEVLMAGAHPLDRCRDATAEVLHVVFEQLYRQGVRLEGIVLKPNMVLPGLDCPRQEPTEIIAEVTMQTLAAVVPPAVPGIAFLSGGQSSELATARLNRLTEAAKSHHAPWNLLFSFARALQTPALEVWGGETANIQAAQRALQHRARCNFAALQGVYELAMEREDA